ncbi:MAG: DUF2309 domain-containing protein [Gammaproteobacteria bacterium]|nr:DUF2309 domain-containing protein [Gammaproteobacteria bacterium]
MNMPDYAVPDQHYAVMAAAEGACKLIAPTWPLDRMIAVNPLWERREQSWQAVAARLWQQSGSLLTLSAEDYASAWKQGRITQSQLQAALDASDLDWSLDDVHHKLEEPINTAHILPLLEEVALVKANVPAWSELITHQIGQFCAAWFDRQQADWQPSHSKGMYATWRDSLQHDYGLTVLSGCNALQQRAAALSTNHTEVLSQAIEQLELDPAHWTDWFDALLQRSLGWASWCAYQRWQAEMQGQQDHSLMELLAIRAAWQLLLDDGERDPGSPWAQWQQAFSHGLKQAPPAHWHALQIWQRADELAWQQQLQASLCAPRVAPAPPSDTFARLYFCIDVRSEVMRRAIEHACPAIDTSGFAGFFGLPIEYAPLGSDTARPQLPGLLAPQMRASDSTGDLKMDQALSRRHNQHQQNKGRWRLFERLPASTFTLVETLGLGYVGKLAARQLGPSGRSLSNVHEQAHLTPVLTGQDTRQKVDLIERILTAMGLRGNFPPLLVLIGHGSQSANNPQLAGLACGACCGQSGEVNVRLLASLLNDAEIRQALSQRGVHLAPNCHAIAGLHNTTTDEIQLFDAQLPTALKTHLHRLRQVLDQATHRARAERASSLGLKNIKDQPEALLRALRKRACDWAQTRPEWGLANNAAFIAAPRHCTRGVDLQGRVFLHDYDWQTDHDGSVLELIMTAPVVVAHWINMQYLTSTTDNHRFGSGNKVLHNVVGGHIGLFEGNGGDLRIGLAYQSLHDGERWMHTPLRLTVVIQAPREMIDSVLAKHQVVRQLVENQWLYLQCLEPDAPNCLTQRNGDGWHPLDLF